MTQLLFTLFIIIQLNTFGQIDSSNLNFNHKILEVKGDLNKDNLEDKVVITQDTISENAPYRLQIFFKDSNGEFKLITGSSKIIEPQFPNGRDGYYTGNSLNNVTIKNEVLSVNFDLTRGHYEHLFRFQNENFELIGFRMEYANGRGECTSTDFNLLTGIRIEDRSRCDIDKTISKSRKKVLIRPLPRLQDVVPLENDFY